MNLADFVYNLLALEGDKSKPSAKINFFTSSFLSPVGLTRELFKRLLTPGNKFTKVNKQPKSVGGHKLWNLNDLFVALVLLSYLLLATKRFSKEQKDLLLSKRFFDIRKRFFSAWDCAYLCLLVCLSNINIASSIWNGKRFLIKHFVV